MDKTGFQFSCLSLVEQNSSLPLLAGVAGGGHRVHELATMGMVVVRMVVVVVSMV